MKKKVIGFLCLSGLLSCVLGFLLQQKRKNILSNLKINKFKIYYNLLIQWLILKQDKISLEGYFEKNGYHKIAIYGMGEIGCRLYEELKDTGIQICYGIDKEINIAYSEIEIRKPSEELEEVDAIIVTPIFAFEEIRDALSINYNYPVVSLEEVIYES